MQDRPTAHELLDALQSFMRDRQNAARDRWEKFQFQVAANSLGIILRELESEDDFMRQEWEGLDRLVGAEPIPDRQAAFTARLLERNANLCERIRNGEFDDAEKDMALQRHIFETVVNKVKIASPKELPA
ncbi:MAG: hypothetical protein IT303_08665 [Dehalococcoidia bacterium]|nr:hypothetical protein [Dehalococcoidia bacterium]